jgi:hypothetical protein
VRQKAHDEQNNENKEADSGNLGRGESHDPETQQASDKRNYEEDQSIVQHGDSFLLTGKLPVNS